MAKRRELWANLVAPQFGGPVFPVSVQVEVTGTSTDFYPVYVCTRDVKIRRASVVQEISPDGTKTLGLANKTDSDALITDAIDSDALAADTASAFTIVSGKSEWSEGDVIALHYVCSSAGSTAPGTVTVTMELEFLELKND